MNLMFLGLIGCVIGLFGIMYTGSVRTRFILTMLGFGSSFGIIHMPSDYHAQSKEVIAYPCDIRTMQDVKEANRVLAMKTPMDVDSVAILFDPLSSKCGDTLYVYHLQHTADIRWLYWNDTRAIITNKSITQYEAELPAK